MVDWFQTKMITTKNNKTFCCSSICYWWLFFFLLCCHWSLMCLVQSVLIIQFVLPTFYLCFSFTDTNFQDMTLHHICDVAYDENRCGPNRTRKCRSTNVAFTYFDFVWCWGYIIKTNTLCHSSFNIKIIHTPGKIILLNSGE